LIAKGPPFDLQETGFVRHNPRIAPEKFSWEVDVPA
jgi:hypothetical protein